jgi:proliferating cell nuclear antigen
MMDSHRQILVDVELKAEQFNLFEIKKSTQIGINLIQFYKMLKSIKKKDSLVLFIEESDPTRLQFNVHPQDNTRKTHSTIQIQNIQNIVVDVPHDYPHPVIISSSEYQCTLKDMNNISSTLRVELQKHSFHISAYSENVVSRCVHFGELNDDSEKVYDENFEIDQFNRILKIAGLSKTLHVHGTSKLPLHIKSNVGQIGVISIFMKSAKQQKN